jgi:mevalonate kinase
VNTTGTGFGHGKVILVGEHAVVYGHAALAAGISAGVTATARVAQESTSPSSRLSVPAWNLDVRSGDGSTVGQALESIVRRLEAPALDVVADARIPSRAGLGSSAALATAVARAAAAAIGRADATEAIQAAVAESEAAFHGNPSGIDAAAASSGAAGIFTRADGWRPAAVLQPITLCVGLSGKPRDTAAQIAGVARLRDRLAAVDHILRALGTLTDEATAALAKGDVDGLGRIFDAAHGLLSALRLSSPELDALVHAARAAGAIGAKLTGAGGGGAVIALAPAHERDVLARWSEAGFDGFLTDIAATKDDAP